MTKKLICLLLTIAALCSTTYASATKPTLIFIPHDDRPISFKNTVDTVKATGFPLLTPPDPVLGWRSQPGNTAEIDKWLSDYVSKADAVILSADMLLYGGLVGSRKHAYSQEVIAQRVERIKKIKEANPLIRLYVFTSLMRSPQFSAGGVEPDYYEQYGNAIFRITAFQDKQELGLLTAQEKRELEELKKSVPDHILQDWLARRATNLEANLMLIKLAQAGIIDYLALGKDDNAPYSQTHRESRVLAKAAAFLASNRYQLISGIDELGLIMLTRAINDLTNRQPTVTVKYAPGKGAATVPSYADEPMEKSVHSHLLAAGILPLPNSKDTDFTLCINTDEKGVTREASLPANLPYPSKSTKKLAADIEKLIKQGVKVAVADVSYANGADNGLMAELEKRKLLIKLTAYSGWNTPNNTVGFAIAQGALTQWMDDSSRQQLLTVRLLDDWAYQANIRSQLIHEIIVPQHGNSFYLDELQRPVTKAANTKIAKFVAQHLADFERLAVRTSFPWNRIFEIDFDITTRKVKVPQSSAL